MTARDYQTTTLVHGDPDYTRLLTTIRRDPRLVAAMWDDAESRPDELDVPGTRWSVVHTGGSLAAWCAARVTGGVLKCHSNYEVREHRGGEAYEYAYRARHHATVAQSDLPSITYLFRRPIHLHEPDGWKPTGATGTGPTGHQWWELRRPSPQEVTGKTGDRARRAANLVLRYDAGDHDAIRFLRTRRSVHVITTDDNRSAARLRQLCGDTDETAAMMRAMTGETWTVCGKRVNRNTKGFESAAQLVGHFPDEDLCRFCHEPFGGRGEVIFEANQDDGTDPTQVGRLSADPGSGLARAPLY